MIKKILKIIFSTLIILGIITIFTNNLYRKECPYCHEVIKFVPRFNHTKDYNNEVYNGYNCPYCKCRLRHNEIKTIYIWE